MQIALIAFQAKHIIAALFLNLRGYFFLATHRINGNYSPPLYQAVPAT